MEEKSLWNFQAFLVDIVLASLTISDTLCILAASHRYPGQLRQERKVHLNDPRTCCSQASLSAWPPFIHSETALSSSCVPSDVLGLGSGGGELCSHKRVTSSLSSGNLRETRKALLSYLTLSSNFKTTVRDAARV